MTILSGIIGGGASFPSDGCRIGFADYNDLATVTTPISVPGGLVDIDITNDGLGPFTNKSYLPTGITDVWDSTINAFDWSGLKFGDMVDIRLDLVVTTSSPNQLVIVDLLLGVGGGQYSIPFISTSFKNAGAQSINRYNGVYMGDANTINNGAKFVIRSDSIATLKVNGWYCKILTRG